MSSQFRASRSVSSTTGVDPGADRASASVASAGEYSLGGLFPFHENAESYLYYG